MIITLCISFSLSAQNMTNENVQSPKDPSLRSHISKKAWEKSHIIPTHDQHSFSKTSSGVDTGWVRHIMSSVNGLSESWATAIQSDANGNVYVTGYSQNTFTGYDFATVKYNSAGVQQWVSRYNSGDNQDDEPSALAVDPSGNVYVTGISANDFATVKYDQSGKELWVARFGNSAIDVPSDIKVDTSGNVYVTGTSNITLDSIYEVGGDYTTIKYNSSGTQQWIVYYGFGDTSEERVAATALDDSGNVYVTGYIHREVNGNVTITHSDFGTIKYNTNGVKQWIAIYNSSANNDDEAIALAVDKSGNVFVAGNSLDSVGRSGCATIKYNSLGEQQWISKYDDGRVVALGIHPSGDVYVLGDSFGDFATIKYDSTGQEKWVAKYSLQYSSSHPSALVVDLLGNVIVTGTADRYECSVCQTSLISSTVKYNSSGVQQWVARFDSTYATSSAVAIDSFGNVYITGSSECFRSGKFGYGPFVGGNYGTIKYDPNGVQQWITRYNGFGKLIVTGAAQNIEVDKLGNSYVAGNDSIQYIMKYNSKGEVLWRALDTSGNIYSKFKFLFVDSAGNVYISGIYRTNMYNTAGVQQWNVQYSQNYPFQYNYFSPNAATVDGKGNVYVTGKFNSYITTVKYNSAGKQQWAIGYHETDDDEAYDLTVDRSGNVYVTGSTGSDCVTIKYNSSGVKLWAAVYNGVGNYVDDAKFIGLDSLGNVYVSGTSTSRTGNGYNTDIITLKYNSAGAQQWVVYYNGPGNGGAVISDFAVDPAGNTYITGSSSDSLNNYENPTIKYNTAGVLQWVKTIKGSGNSWGKAILALGQTGNVYVTGTSGVAITGNLNDNFTTIKYSSTGIEEWIAHYKYPGNKGGSANSIAVDLSGNVYVAGTSNVIGGSISTIIKYVQTPTSVAQKNLPHPNNFALQQNYPNPFNPSTVISYQLPVISKVTLRIYDVLGREVATLVNEEQSAGWKEVEWNASGVASGIYFYRIKAGFFTALKKMTLLK